MKKCDNCGKKIISGSISLSRGLKLCKKCAAIIPQKWHKDVTRWDINEYVAYADYRGKEKERHGRFIKTDKIKKLILDAENGYFYINGGILFPSPIDGITFDIRNLVYYNFQFIPEKQTKGLFYTTVTGRITFEVEMSFPRIRQKYDIGDMTAKFKNPPPGMQNIKLEYPPIWEQFISKFQYTAEQFTSGHTEGVNTQRNEDIKRRPQDRKPPVKEQPKINPELANALALFMFSDISEVTPEKLKNQRNKLIKTFHADNGEESSVAAQKINCAYDLLKKEISKNI